MSKSDQKQIIAALLERYGRTFASELGIDLESEAPTSLFRWLCAALLFSARIGNAIAVEAARPLTKAAGRLRRRWPERLRRSGRTSSTTPGMRVRREDVAYGRYLGAFAEALRRWGFAQAA